MAARETAVLAGGCFWCLEAVYQRVRGVEHVESGYAGGDRENPTYHDHGTHAEVVQIQFDPETLSYETLLDIFWVIHDPTTLNRQGNDVGPQYRSMILYASEAQQDAAKTSLEAAQAHFDDPIVTEIKELGEFYKAEDYHQNYYNSNPGNPYCSVVIGPKIAKFESKFADLLIDNE